VLSAATGVASDAGGVAVLVGAQPTIMATNRRVLTIKNNLLRFEGFCTCFIFYSIFFDSDQLCLITVY
jgi:hypothetical protein